VKYDKWLSRIFQDTNEGIILSNQEGKIVLANPRASVVLGYEEGELLEISIEDLVPEDLRKKHTTNRHSFFKKSEARAMGKGMTLYAQKKDKTLLPVEISLSPISIEGERMVLSFIIDRTEFHAKNKQLLDKTKELEETTKKLVRINKELQQFAYIASHDLQEPLRKIQAFGDRLNSREKENLSEKGALYLDRMTNAAERMQNLIKDLLSFSRVSQSQELFSETDLNKVLENVLSDLEIIIQSSNASINLETELPILIGNESQLHQLFMNLINNSIKFRHPDRTPIINIRYSLTGEGHEFLLSDNGLGFDQKYSDKIFEVFQRLSGSGSSGSGIGLAICKKIVENHDGVISAKSIVNSGSEFKFVIPDKINSND